jgi:acyl-CoA thioester hydrolase
LKNPLVVETVQVRYQDLDPYGHVNNAVHLQYFETARVTYLGKLVDHLGFGPLAAGDIPGMRYVVAEATVRYKSPIFLEEPLFGAASVRVVSNRSFVMDYELRAGESYENGRVVAEGTSAQVFYELDAGEVRPRPEWFLPAVAAMEGRSEESFAPPEEGRG